ncbi:MAG TPA: hypothetical protein DDX29_02150 [Clostridiales bacterium]|nr:hypothetical protein [Clostridiales bacterium]
MKDKYDSALNELNILMKKKQELQGKELLNAFVNTSKSLDEILANYLSVKEKINLLEETVEDDLEKLALSKDEDAKVGHKTHDTSFFGKRPI